MSGKQTTPTPPVCRAHLHTHQQKACIHYHTTHADIRTADDTRRSGRANKGQHTKLPDLLDEPVAPKSNSQPKASKKGQSKGRDAGRAQSTQTPEAEQDDGEEEDAIIRCVCGDQRDIRGRQMICCDRCEAWQHNKCLNLPEGDYWEDRTYFCEQCKPENHEDLLAAMARGEKPWARKKGSKQKARPSDVKPDTPSASVPTPSHTPVPAVQATPTPAPPSVQTLETSNGHAEKVCSSSSRCLFLTNSSQIKSQPQSPVGEKRRHEAAPEKANASKKRRKSSHQDKAAAPPTTAADIDSLPQAQKAFAEKLRDVLTPLINTASSTRGYRIPDGETASSLASRLALPTILETVAHHGEVGGGDSPFSLRLRAIMFNVKKNTVLIDRLLSGSLKPQDLATMATEEMASEDKQREFAAMREAAEKQMILTEETGPRMRKTHKGEEMVGEDNEDFKEPARRETVAEDAAMQSPVTQRPPESPAAAANPLSVDTTGTPTDSARRPSTNFDINNVFDKVKSPQHDQQQFLQRRQSSMHTLDKPQAPVDDADVDRLLKDEDNDVEMTGYSSDPTVCWQGSVTMQSLQSFDAVARFVAGGDFGQVVPWDKLLAKTLSVQGRIEYSKGDEYIRGIGTGHHETYDVAVLALSPVTPEGRGIFDNFYEYFRSRGRWGVVPVDNTESTIMRDLYIIPIEAGGSNLPPFIDMLEYCTIETPRKEHMVLLALVAKLPEKSEGVPTEHFERYPAQEIAAAQIAQPIPTPPQPPNPHAPQYSPMASSFPPQSQSQSQPPTQHQQPAQGQYGNPFAPPHPSIPPHHQIPKALDILGPYIDTPVVKHVLHEQLSKGTPMTVDMMEKLRHIIDQNELAASDFKVFSETLAIGASRGEGGGN